MSALGSYLLGNLVSVLVALVVVTIAFWKWKYQYWKRRNVPYLEPGIPFGNMEDVIRGKKFVGITLKGLYKEMRSRGWKHGGIYTFTKPSYVPLDLDYVRNIMTKDFKTFMDRDIYVNEKDPLQAHLLNLSGTRWRNMRAKLTPTFTSGKMKAMFQVMAESQKGLQKKMDEEYKRNQAINIKEILACFTTNIIGSCAFGLDCQALEDEDSAFRVFGRKIFTVSKLQTFKRLFAVTFPQLAKLLHLSLTRKEQSNFITNMVQDTIEYREKNNYTRNDFMQLLINLKNNKSQDFEGHDGKPLSLDEVASQALVFFVAGFETSSTLMTFALYELARHEDIQEKLRREINSVLEQHNGQMTYDSIQDMKYLSQVIDETLRMHPPATQTNRKCLEDYKIPGQDVIIEKGTTVIIPIMGIHYDEEYYPEPEKFDPERFTDENKRLRHNFAHIPFGEGPRNCIGMRFGLLQSKMGLVSLLKNYNFTVNKKTMEPLQYKPNHFVLAAQGDIWLNAEKIENI
jgi:cytochrome P450 family 6